MTEEHPNVTLLKALDPTNLAKFAELLAEGFVWHFFNPSLPDVQRDYRDYMGLSGLQAFFEKLGVLTGGTFQVESIAIIPFGDELVVTHVKDSMMWDGQPHETDAVVVWRIVNGRIAEAWDIPSVHTKHLQTAT